MKIKGLFLLLFVFNGLFAVEFREVSKREFDEIQRLPVFQKSKTKLLKAYDIKSLYVLSIDFKNRKQEVYLSKDKKVLLSGELLDANTTEDITAPTDISLTKGKEALTFGKGRDEYILFTDMECPYCKKFQSFLPQLEKQVKIKVFFYPLTNHSNAKNLALFVLSQKSKKKKIETFLDPDKKLFKKFLKDINTLPNKKELEKQLQEQIKIAKKLGVSGLPTIFDEKGNKVVWTSILKKYNLVAN